jgi:hypothetical protein
MNKSSRTYSSLKFDVSLLNSNFVTLNANFVCKQSKKYWNFLEAYGSTSSLVSLNPLLPGQRWLAFTKQSNFTFFFCYHQTTWRELSHCPMSEVGIEVKTNFYLSSQVLDNFQLSKCSEVGNH